MAEMIARVCMCWRHASTDRTWKHSMRTGVCWCGAKGCLLSCCSRLALVDPSQHAHLYQSSISAGRVLRIKLNNCIRPAFFIYLLLSCSLVLPTQCRLSCRATNFSDGTICTSSGCTLYKTLLACNINLFMRIGLYMCACMCCMRLRTYVCVCKCVTHCCTAAFFRPFRK